MNKREQILTKLQSALSPKRYKHTLGVEKTAIHLAKHYNISEEKVSIAALLHDCARNIPEDVMIEYAKLFHMEINEYKAYPQVLHSFLGAKIAEKEYNITDDVILNAIRYHTTGRPNMTLLEKIVFISDYIEPGRMPFKGLQEIREKVYEDLDLAIYMTLKNTITYLTRLNKSIHPLTFDSEEYYRQKNIEEVIYVGHEKSSTHDNSCCKSN